MALDIIFISYDEPNANENWYKLSSNFPIITKRIHGISGILEAHKKASEISSTGLFYVVDGDAEILPNFDFSFRPKGDKQDYTHVWRSKNPVNGLDYGYGGIKILSKKFFKNSNENVIDITSSVSKGLIVHNEIASITRFNSSPFHAWRAGFRECVKLSSKIINKQIDEETENRLKIWTTLGSESMYGEYVIHGAILGKKYGEKNKNNFKMLIKINDFSWLLTMFNNHFMYKI